MTYLVKLTLLNATGLLMLMDRHRAAYTVAKHFITALSST